MAEAKRIRVKKRRHRYKAFRWLLAAPVIVLGVALWMLTHPRSGPPLLPGYIADPVMLNQEYMRFYSKPLTDEDVKQQFQKAAALTAIGDYRGAVASLEAATKQAAVPLIFNDLGLLYERLDDRSRAINSFRDALSRDLSYFPARTNLNRLQATAATDSAAPVSQEVEPNDNSLSANLVALDKSVDAEIAAGQGDVDFYRFSAPPAPRDILTLDIANRSKTLAPMVSLYDEVMRPLDWHPEEHEPGASLNLRFSPEPNAKLFIQVRGYADSSGAYTLTLHALRAFDAYEPNDDIINARRIDVNRTIDANIMDAKDTDYYSFVAPRTGKATIEIRNHSTTLIPQLSLFTPEQRASGFGPDVRTKGANLTCDMPVSAGLVYFIQVWSQEESAGAYSLTIK
ncbi:MAG: hypothetical protein ABSC23_11415 [Bryobacteraceae bacterium]|jgi:tetratricopeptide (TPR) repeat protein